MRINKFLAQCGLGSRRKVEELITGGKITVNGQVISDLGRDIDVDNDIVEYHGQELTPASEFTYLMLNKPRGYITTLRDEKGRFTVMDLLPEKYLRAGVFPVGRLDKDTEGLLLLTNDGDFARKLSHPSSHLEKKYFVEIDRPLQDPDRKKIEKGIFLHQLKLKTLPARIQVIHKSGRLINMTIREGKKRQIRYSLKKFGYRVINLKRISYGSLELGALHRGETRQLKSHEVKKLKNALGE